MQRNPNLYATVTIHWQTVKGYDRDCDVDVVYTFDGEDLNILSSDIVGACELEPHNFDGLVWEAVNERADEDLAEWEADRGDYLYEQQRDRLAPEGYVPGDLL